MPKFPLPVEKSAVAGAVTPPLPVLDFRALFGVQPLGCDVLRSGFRRCHPASGSPRFLGL